jgi:hypothetical protein
MGGAALHFATNSSSFVGSNPTTMLPSITVTGMVIHPSFCSSSSACSSAAMFRSVTRSALPKEAL